MKTNTKPKVQINAVIATLNIGAFRASIIHRDETRTVNDTNKVRDVATVRVTITEHPALLACYKVNAQAYAINRQMTASSGVDGWRFLPSHKQLEHAKAMKELKEKHDKHADEFCAAYPAEAQAAPVRLGPLYRPEFFPHPDTIRPQFKFDVRYLPVPDHGTWQDWIADAAEAAQAEVRDNLRDAIEKAANVLADPKGIFRDSLIANIAEIAGTSVDLNVSGAKDIATVAQAAATDLATLDPVTLRENPDARQIAAQRAAAIAKMLAA